MFTDKQVSYTCQKSGKTLVSFEFLKPIIAQRLKTKTQTFNIISKTSVSDTGSVSFEPSSRRRSQWADWACRAHIFFTSSVSFLKKEKKKNFKVTTRSLMVWTHHPTVPLLSALTTAPPCHPRPKKESGDKPSPVSYSLQIYLGCTDFTFIYRKQKNNLYEIITAVQSKQLYTTLVWRESMQQNHICNDENDCRCRFCHWRVQ